MLKLLNRPKPYPNESLEQYIFRLTNNNGYVIQNTARLIKNASGISMNALGGAHREELKVTIMNLTGHKDVLYLFDPRKFYYRYQIIFDYSRTKVCSHCLLENDYCYSHWHFRHTLVCEKHQCLLIDRCRSCSELFSKKTLVAMHCTSCKVDIRYKVNNDNLIISRIYKSFFSCEELAELSNKMGELKPYFELYQEKSYKLWSKTRAFPISGLVELVNEVIDIFYNKEQFIHSMNKYLCNEINGESIQTIPYRIHQFLYHDKYPLFTSTFAESLLTQSKRFPSAVILCNLVDRLYRIKSTTIYQLTGKESMGIIFLRTSAHAIYLGRLEDVLALCDYKYS